MQKILHAIKWKISQSMAIKPTLRLQNCSIQQSKNFPLVVVPLTWVPGGEDLLCAAMQGHPSRAE